MKKIVICLLFIVVLIAAILIGGIGGNDGMQSKFTTFVFGNNGDVTIYGEEETDMIDVEDIESVEIFPLEKITINDIDISLGMDKAEVIKLLGEGEASGESVRYFESELGIYYDSDNKAEFIEFYSGIDGKLKPTIYGVPVFQTKASELTAIITEHDKSGITYAENASELEFKNLSVGVYRDVTPDSVASMKDEMIAEGVFDEKDEDYLYDLERSQYWATIGIGVEWYYK